MGAVVAMSFDRVKQWWTQRPRHDEKTHLGRVLAKLDLRDRVQVVVFAYENGLVSPGRP